MFTDTKYSVSTLHQEKTNNYYRTKTAYAFNRASINETATEITYSVAAPNHPLYTHTVCRSQTELHHHDYFELVYVLSGEFTQQLENTTDCYQSGQCCILNRNVKHSEIYTGKAELLFIMLTEDFLSPLINKQFIYSLEDPYHNSFESICHLISQNQKCKYYTTKEYIKFTPTLHASSPQFQHALSHTINSMISATQEMKAGCIYITAGLLSRVFSMLENPENYIQESICLVGSNDDNLIQRITTILKENRGRVNRTDLEMKIHYNADYLNRVVKRSTGLTLVEYGHIFSLEEAALLLTTTNTSIVDIVSELGFSNRNYFNKLFIQKYEMTPSQYRSKHKTSLLNHK